MKNIFKRIVFISFIAIHFHGYSQWEWTNGPEGGEVSSLFMVDSNLFAAASYGGLYISNDTGSTWTFVDSPGNLMEYNCIYKYNSTLFAGTHVGVFKSIDGGYHWNYSNCYGETDAIVSIGDSLFAATVNGLKFSTNNGSTWSSFGSGLPQGQSIGDMIYVNNTLYCSLIFYGVYRSSDYGQTWAPINNGLDTTKSFFKLAYNNSKLFIGVFGVGIYRTDINSISWQPANNGIYANTTINAFCVLDDKIYAAGVLGSYCSTDNGNSWSLLYSTSIVLNTIIAFNAPGYIDPFILVGGDGIGVTISTDGGNSWAFTNNGLRATYCTSLLSVDQHLLTGTRYDGIFKSEDGGDSWIQDQSTVNRDVYCLYMDSCNSDTVVFAGLWHSVLHSYDYGDTWVASTSGLAPCPHVFSITVCGSRVFCVISSEGVYYSDDCGLTWSQSPVSENVKSIISHDSLVYVSSSNSDSIFVSSDLGNSWNYLTTGPYGSPYYFNLFVNKERIYAGNESGMFYSEDNGLTWSQFSGFPAYIKPNCLAQNDSLILVGLSDFSIMMSLDWGNNWADISGGQLKSFTNSLAIDSNYFYAGLGWHGVWRYPITPLLYNEPKFSNEAFTVYPNPSSGKVIVLSDIPLRNVSISLEDITGRRKFLSNQLLIKENLELDFTDQPEGVYILRIESESDIFTNIVIISR